MLSITINHQQRRELDALAYWIADDYYIRERFGVDEPERQRARLTVAACFDALDALGVPFWLQNVIIQFAEDWRRYGTDSWINWANTLHACGDRAYNIAVEG